MEIFTREMGWAVLFLLPCTVMDLLYQKIGTALLAAGAAGAVCIAGVKLAEGRTDFWDDLGKKIPLERCGVPEDIGEAVAFLASEKASYITGATLRIDGGLILPGMPERVVPGEDPNGWSKARSLFAEEVLEKTV